MLWSGPVPSLQRPIVVAAFEGWNDAGEAATTALEHLMQIWQAQPMAALDPEDYYDFQVNRPVIGMQDGQRQITWPTTRISVGRTASGQDVVLMRGIEPSMRWAHFCTELIEVIHTVDASMMVSLGALLTNVPHTRPIPVTVTTDDPVLRRRYDVDTSLYEGPTGIVGVLADLAQGSGTPVVSAWAAVPHYAGGPPSPKAALALISAVEDLLSTPIPPGELEEAAQAWTRGVDMLAAEDEEIAEYVRALEEEQDAADLPEASGDAIAKEFERYLNRHRGDESEHG